MTAAQETHPSPTASRTVSVASAVEVRLYADLAVLFLLAGAALLIVAYAGIAWPDMWLGGSLAEYLSYGRALPMATTTLVFGWLTFGLTAAMYHFLPRLLGVDLELKGAARANAILMAIGVGSGVAAIGLGQGVGGRFIELPWYSDVVLAVSFLITAVVVTATVKRSGVEQVGVPVWYFLAASWWLFLVYTAGAIPGLNGAPAELQSAFTGTGLFGMWIAPVAVGSGYALIAAVVPDAHFHPRLGRIGFWSLGLLWALTTARTLQYGPTADWMETIPVLFSVGLILTVMTIAADYSWALRGRWDHVTRSSALRLLGVGTLLFAIVPGLMFIQSLRSSSAVIRFTAWDAGFDLLAVLGAFSVLTLAVLAHALAQTSGRSWAPSAAIFIGVPVVGGTLFAVGTRWVAGLQQGYTWLGGAESKEFDSVGDGFFNTVAPLHGADVLTVVGLAVATLGLVVFAAGVVRRLGVSAEVSPIDTSSWPDVEDPSVIRRGAAVVFALVVMIALVLPAIDADREPSRLADRSHSWEAGSLESHGRDLYVSEGCWYCHTQQVRAIVTDVGLGAVSVTGDYAYDPPGIMGVARIGPDLTHAGTRAPTDDPQWIADHLGNPRIARPWSVMPSYAHLGDSDLEALAAYIAGLE